MKRPNFEPIISEEEAAERSSDVPISTFIPHQAISLAELVSRFERGQRLNVHSNFAPMSNFTNGSIYEDSFDDAAPDDVHDIVDVEMYYAEHESHKKEYAERKKKAKNDAAQRKPAKEDLPDPKPDDPA